MSINMLKSNEKRDTMYQPVRPTHQALGVQAQGEPADHILVSRGDLEAEHRTLLQRLHQIRRLLGLSELQTAHKQRQQHGDHIR